MEVKLAPQYTNLDEAKQAKAIISSCVHCGFCNAVCPTYNILKEENDGPRGRIYQIKQFLESNSMIKDSIHLHLDRCLTCCSCQTTCPSGVQYGNLIEIARELVEKNKPRKIHFTLFRDFLIFFLKSKLFYFTFIVARFLRPFLPNFINKFIPVPTKLQANNLQSIKPLLANSRTIILIKGCVQDALLPSINQACNLLFLKLGFNVIEIAGCCGALEQHLGKIDAAQEVRQTTYRNIKPHLAKADLITMNASGCSVSLLEIGEKLNLSNKMRFELHNKIQDTSVFLGNFFLKMNDVNIKKLQSLIFKNKAKIPQKIAYHPPCTLQHTLQSKDAVPNIFKAFGINLYIPEDSHLCCGSAGTYSIVHPKIANKLKENKIRKLEKLKPKLILSANVGCITHLSSNTNIRVIHWLEFLAQLLEE